MLREKIRNLFFWRRSYFNNLKINLDFSKFVIIFGLINLIVFGLLIVRKYNTTYNNFFITLSFCSVSYLILISFFALILFKKYYKIVLSTLIFLNSIVFYFMITYGISFDINMLINATETNYNEASEFIKFSLFAFIILLGVIPAIFVYKKVNISFENYFKKKLLLIFTPLLLIILIATPFRFSENGKTFLRNNQ